MIKQNLGVGGPFSVLVGNTTSLNLIGNYHIISYHAYILTTKCVQLSQTNPKQFVVVQHNLPADT